MEKKIVKKLFAFVLVTILLFALTTSTFATSKANVTLKLVEDNVCTINLGDKATFEKKLTNFDAEGKSATLTLTVKNTMKSSQTEEPAEVFLVIDNSDSMINDKVGDVTRKAKVIESANTLVDKLFNVNSKIKVGIVSFSSLDSTKGETEGTINDAHLELALSNSKEDVKSTISSIESKSCGPHTNIEAGLTVAANNYSSEKNTGRYIVLLTDGVPNNDLSGNFVTYIGDVAKNTKAKISEIRKSGIKIIGAMIGLSEQKIETQSNKTYKVLAEEVFGTVNESTIDNYYYVTDNQIENTIANDIYSSLIKVTDSELKDIVVKDYFPKEIIDNFNFAYVGKQSTGKISSKVDTTDNSITWNIASLKSGETAKVTYKLTLKDDFDKTIIDKILPTNKKVDFSGKNDEKTISNSSDVSPKVQVIAKSAVVDNTIAPKTIPQTGETSAGIVFATIVTIIAIIAGMRYVHLKNKDK